MKTLAALEQCRHTVQQMERRLAADEILFSILTRRLARQRQELQEASLAIAQAASAVQSSPEASQEEWFAPMLK
jgi:hypothetical protein